MPEGQVENFGSDKICDREPVEFLEFLSMEMAYEIVWGRLISCYIKTNTEKLVAGPI